MRNIYFLIVFFRRIPTMHVYNVRKTTNAVNSKAKTLKKKLPSFRSGFKNRKRISDSRTDTGSLVGRCHDCVTHLLKIYYF